jgi:hypothetical protein
MDRAVKSLLILMDSDEKQPEIMKITTRRGSYPQVLALIHR